MKRVLITGVSGFAGSFLADQLSESGEYEIHGFYNQREPKIEKVFLHQVNLLDKDSVQKAISQIKPDQVYHLAALASPRLSFQDPTNTYKVNINSQLNIFESLVKYDLFNTRVLITSTAEVYGVVNKDDLPIGEDLDLKPVSPYAVSKVTQELIGLQYSRSYNFDVIISRSFNHIGPRQKDNYAIASFAKQIAEIESKGNTGEIRVGNLDSKRDLTDVRDIVRAYELLMVKGKSGQVYNVGRGESFVISKILDMLVKLSASEIKIKVDSDRFNKVEIPDNISDNSKLISATGWRPSIDLEQSLKDTLDYWRNII